VVPGLHLLTATLFVYPTLNGFDSSIILFNLLLIRSRIL